MAKTIAFVLLRLIATLFAVTFLTFLMVALLPGDPVDTILGTGPRAPGIEEQIREDLNLDDPFLVRYFTWLGDAVTGDLGTSYVTDQPVSDTISSRLPGHRTDRVHVDLHRCGGRHSRRRTRRIQTRQVARHDQFGRRPGRAVDPELHLRHLPHLALRGAARVAPCIELEPSQRRTRRQPEDRDPAGAVAGARPDGALLAPRSFRHDGHAAGELHPVGPRQGPQRPLHPVPPRAAAQLAQPDDDRRHQPSAPCSAAPSSSSRSSPFPDSGSP